MASAKQRAWRKKFARLYGKKKGRKSRLRRPKRVRTMARRRRRSYAAPRRRRYGRKTKRGYSISLLSLAHLCIQYSNITGQDLGATLQALINSIMNGDDSFLDIILTTVNAAIDNVTKNALPVAMKGAIIALVFSQLKNAVGSRKLIGVGKFSIRV